MPVPEMLRELADVLASDEYQRDPAGCLHAWADVVSGRIRPSDRVAIGGNRCAGRNVDRGDRRQDGEAPVLL